MHDSEKWRLGTGKPEESKPKKEPKKGSEEEPTED